MRTPLSPIEYVERERRLLLARRGRQSVRPLVRRLIAEDTDNLGLAAEIVRVAEARAIVPPPYRSVAEQRALLVRCLDAIALLIPLAPREDAALNAFLAHVDTWTEPVN